MTASPMAAKTFWSIIERAAEFDHDPDDEGAAFRG
jgi:hypothetical protein